MARFRLLAIALVSLGLILGFAIAARAELVLADFDSGSKPNNLGGDFGSWNKDPQDKTQNCNIAFYKEPEGGYSLALDYDVDSPNPAYNGFWMKLEGKDLSQYRYLVISIKGDELNGFSSQISLELKNQREVGKYVLKGITGEWNKFAIPLSDFKGLTSLRGMTEFVIVFDDLRSNPKKGKIYIDDIYVE